MGRLIVDLKWVVLVDCVDVETTSRTY